MTTAVARLFSETAGNFAEAEVWIDNGGPAQIFLSIDLGRTALRFPAPSSPRDKGSWTSADFVMTPEQARALAKVLRRAAKVSERYAKGRKL